MKTRGILITFEGTEGAGKSTLIRALEKLLIERGHSVVVTREPGGSVVAERIRDLILHTDMSPWTELFLYEASRCEHLEKTLTPALNAGHIVLCDRFTDSTLAYQGAARGLPWKTIRTLNGIAVRGLKPALKILVDIDPALGLKDAKNPNRFEAEGVKFQQAVRKGFLKAMRENPRRWMKIRARTGTPEQMAEGLLKSLEKRLPRLRSAKRSR